MTAPHDDVTERLLDQAARGDAAASQQLLERERRRLRQMIAFRIDPRLAARLDPSDVVQEVMMDAHSRLPEYLRERPVPFYPLAPRTGLRPTRRRPPPPRPGRAPQRRA